MAVLRMMTLAAALIGAAPAFAVDGPDRDAGRAAIDRQLDAFARDDAPAAYGEAAPGIRQMFPTDEIFMGMVRQGYRPVVQARSHQFGPERDVDGGFEQAVAIQDRDGGDWDAIYTLEHQADGSWKISGCRLVKRPGEAV